MLDVNDEGKRVPDYYQWRGGGRLNPARPTSLNKLILLLSDSPRARSDQTRSQPFFLSFQRHSTTLNNNSSNQPSICFPFYFFHLTSLQSARAMALGVCVFLLTAFD